MRQVICDGCGDVALVPHRIRVVQLITGNNLLDYDLCGVCARVIVRDWKAALGNK